MSDEETKTTEQSAGKKPPKAVMVGGIVVGMLAVQAVGVFVAVKLFSKAPAEAEAVSKIADVDHNAEIDEGEKTSEIQIARIECPHTNTGRLYVIRMTVYATVPARLMETHDEGEGGGHGGGEEESQEDTGIQAKINAKIATIKDRMRTIVASSDAGTLTLTRTERPDYGLSTLRRQFKAVIEDVLGKGVVKDVLISDYMPTPIE